MLIKTYSSTGAFPNYGNKGTQLNIERATGKPTTMRPTSRTINKIMRIRHQLKGEVCFYAVTHLVGDMLIVVSDDQQSRFWWENNGKRHTYCVDEPVRGYEDAWRLLFEALVVDKRPKAVNLYKAMGGFFGHALNYQTYGSFVTRVKSDFNDEPCMISLSVDAHTARGCFDVVFSQFGSPSVKFSATFHTPLFSYIGRELKRKV